MSQQGYLLLVPNHYLALADSCEHRRYFCLLFYLGLAKMRILSCILYFEKWLVFVQIFGLHHRLHHAWWMQMFYQYLPIPSNKKNISFIQLEVHYKVLESWSNASLISYYLWISKEMHSSIIDISCNEFPASHQFCVMFGIIFQLIHHLT